MTSFFDKKEGADGLIEKLLKAYVCKMVLIYA